MSQFTDSKEKTFWAALKRLDERASPIPAHAESDGGIIRGAAMDWERETGLGWGPGEGYQAPREILLHS